jgi:hypothetical protein
MRGELPADFAAAADAYIAKLQAEGPGGLAQGLADGARSLRAAAAGTDRRLGRPGRHSNLTICGRAATRRQRRRPERQLRLLRRARVRHDRDRQRPGAARRLHALRRDLPGVQRLRAQRGAHERADPDARPSTSTPTTRSAWARTARPTSRSSIWPACATSRTTGSGAPATRSSRRWLEGRDRAPRRPELPGVHPPEPAHQQRATRRRSPTSRAAATC